MKNWITFLVILLAFHINAQEPQEEQNYNDEITDAEIDSVDWINMKPIDLGETRAYALKLDTDLEKKYYRWLEKRVDDVYPFVKKFVEEYYHVKDSVRAIDNKRAKKKFINRRYNQLADAYEAKMRKLTTSRGQILVKLMERETKVTTYDMVKEMRGGVNAALWNSAGGVFNIDLKTRFDPKLTREDRYLEVIIRRGIASGKYPEIDIIEERLENLNPIINAFGRK